jgi:hypothetical protein
MLAIQDKNKDNRTMSNIQSYVDILKKTPLTPIPLF